MLYRYFNPHMLGVVTQWKDTEISSFGISIYLIDGITGSVLYKIMHRAARPPVRAVLAENWLVYAFWSDGASFSSAAEKGWLINVVELYQSGEANVRVAT